ncbi:M28 family metallopeptidase [Noviluteimonas gilva]|uniref:M28 family peptidase n=1 Tax=Noviluteimonas gilva TaxID=2682097 RepID=A0A7C9HKQ1_9GAMM|nr:M28 family metallopeptidase [Lysobacter gilvus]MUV13016.1 M28 family peptidase [Lysobacter gilvus]
MPSTQVRPLLILLAGAVALAGCNRASDSAAPVTSATSAPAAASTATAPAPASTHAFVPEIVAGDFSEHVRVLASDAFEGRAPGSPGEQKTVDYLVGQFKSMGLQPGNNGEWTQVVPMTETTSSDKTTMQVVVKGKPHTLKFGDDMVIGTRSGQKHVSVHDSDVVFVGYGVDAPEQQWNDYAGLDVKGKTVVILVNDPGFHANDPSLFEGRRMTWYGRWVYKFEEAARKGAAAALIVHDDAGASYGWDVVRGSWSGAQFDLRASDDPAPRLPVQGWITGDQAKALFADAGLDFEKLRAAANKRGFKAVPLDAKASVTLDSTIVEKTSRNVVAKLPGTERPNEAVVYLAHWDHLGKHPDETGDNIYNGAIDNATGVAGILEIAGEFAKAPPKRTVMFLAVTLEESGLLGSKYYVAHPAVPLKDTVAAINIDAMSTFGPSKDIVVTGLGNSELDDVLKTIADKQGRTLHAEATPESGFYFRSDHFNFAKAGVPALYAEGGEDLVEGGSAAGRKAAEDYTTARYHKPADEFDANWNLQGTMQDLDTLYQVGRVLADGTTWPNWRAGNPFRAARDASREGAKTP